jgi:hypothetical protein
MLTAEVRMDARPSRAATPGDPADGPHDRLDPWEILAPDPFERDLELIAMSADAWRLCDGRVPRDDAASVIAYVERADSGVDVVWLQGRHGQAHFSCIQDVLSAARILLPGGSAGPTRPVPIAHRAPHTG